MRNITVTIDDDSYTRARVWAAQRDTSVSAVVRYILETMPGVPRAVKAFPLANSYRIKAKPAPVLPPTAQQAVLAGEPVDPHPNPAESSS
jgi:hypothetical protein